MHWVHAVNNTALLTYALAAAGGDFDRSICLAVMGGWDTDSNGATAGAVAGALGGTDASAAAGRVRCRTGCPPRSPAWTGSPSTRSPSAPSTLWSRAH